MKAMDLGFGGLIIESHAHPEKALSDKEQQLKPSELKALIGKLKHRPTTAPFLVPDIAENLEDLRSQIGFCDHELSDHTL
ncbi:MAG: hypothetical protein MZV63_57270 [Marinilabiliales bacterium]|nr:hypothetical protein [Marinilabiliales bacterium]